MANNNTNHKRLNDKYNDNNNFMNKKVHYNNTNASITNNVNNTNEKYSTVYKQFQLAGITDNWFFEVDNPDPSRINNQSVFTAALPNPCPNWPLGYFALKVVELVYDFGSVNSDNLCESLLNILLQL
eukprot:Awhi_evm1s4573